MSEVNAFLGPSPMVGLVAGVLAVNAVAGAAIVGVMAVRVPVRRLFGPAVAYQLWLMPPIVALLTALFVFVPSDSAIGSLAAAVRAPNLDLVLPLWALGALAVAGLFTLSQARFTAQVRAGRGGPAVVGFIAPRVVLPADDGRYSADERELIRAHERAHVARKDPRGAAFISLFQCLCWFNPLVHVAAHLLRMDQEMACDAAVVMSRPGCRALYARTLLKAQLDGAPLPFGCYLGQHPLETRIASLKRTDGRKPVAPGSRWCAHRWTPSAPSAGLPLRNG
jgi:beta-lactamase regulating signal transducer with metallopeptidase domain